VDTEKVLAHASSSHPARYCLQNGSNITGIGPQRQSHPIEQTRYKLASQAHPRRAHAVMRYDAAKTPPADVRGCG
jgi:hypothetical protein